MPEVQLTVPDIGDFNDVPVIEVLVKPGDVVEREAPLVTLESEKATMEVPADAAGTVRDVKVRIGDKVSKGSVIATIETAADVPSQEAATPSAPLAAAAGAVAPPVSGRSTESAELAVPQDAGARPSSSTSASAPPAATAGGETELSVPDLGGFSDVPVIEILASPGQSVDAETPIVMLESEKATMEVPAGASGTLRELRVQVGDRVSSGTILGTIASSAPASQVATASPRAETALASSPPPQPAAAPPATSSAPAPAPAPTASAPPAVAPSSYGAPGSNGSSTAASEPQAPPESVTPAHASPAIRRFARELGVNLARVRGSGPNGRITRDDVQGFVKRALANGAVTAAPSASPVTGPLAGLPPWPVVDFAKFGPVERKPLSRIQKLSGPNLARNWVMIPHVTQNEDADVTEVEAFRKSVNEEQRDVKVTMLAFLIKACVAALQRFPEFNASLDREEIVLKRYFHIGFAADTPNGLVVPVVRDADRKGIVEIARDSAALAAKARDGKLTSADMQGGTFSISSLGGIGGTYFTPIINAPEVAILGAGRAETRPVWDGKAFVPRLILPLSLSYDHRVIDGATAARFVTYLAKTLGDLRRALL